MIQSQFSYYKDVSLRSATMTPSSSGFVNMPKLSYAHKKNSKFSDKIVHHGGHIPVTTMEESERIKMRTQMHVNLKFNSIDSLVSNFEAEAAKLMKIKVKLHNKQSELESQSRKVFAAIKIQTSWRCNLSRKSVRKARAMRFLSQYIRFRHYYKRLKRAARVVTDLIRTFRQRKWFLLYSLQLRSVRRVQAKWKRYRQNKIIHAFMILIGTLKITVNHILLFGTRKAFHTIMDNYELSLYQNAHERLAVRKFVAAWRIRRRYTTLRGPLGKTIFYMLMHMDTLKDEDPESPVYNVHSPKTSTYHSRHTSMALSPEKAGNLMSNILSIQSAPKKTQPQGSNFIMDYLKLKVDAHLREERQARRRNQAAKQPTNMTRRGGTISRAAGTKITLTNKQDGNTIEIIPPLTPDRPIPTPPGSAGRSRNTEINHGTIANLNHDTKVEKVPLYTRDQMPRDISGKFGPRNLPDVILMLVDMKRVCLENPHYVDDIPPVKTPEPSFNVTPTAVEKNVKGRKGKIVRGKMRSTTATPGSSMTATSMTARSTTVSGSSMSSTLPNESLSLADFDDPENIAKAVNRMTTLVTKSNTTINKNKSMIGKASFGKQGSMNAGGSFGQVGDSFTEGVDNQNQGKKLIPHKPNGKPNAAGLKGGRNTTNASGSASGNGSQSTTTINPEMSNVMSAPSDSSPHTSVSKKSKPKFGSQFETIAESDSLTATATSTRNNSVYHLELQTAISFKNAIQDEVRSAAAAVLEKHQQQKRASVAAISFSDSLMFAVTTANAKAKAEEITQKQLEEQKRSADETLNVVPTAASQLASNLMFNVRSSILMSANHSTTLRQSISAAANAALNKVDGKDPNTSTMTTSVSLKSTGPVISTSAAASKLAANLMFNVRSSILMSADHGGSLREQINAAATAASTSASSSKKVTPASSPKKPQSNNAFKNNKKGTHKQQQPVIERAMDLDRIIAAANKKSSNKSPTKDGSHKKTADQNKKTAPVATKKSPDKKAANSQPELHVVHAVSQLASSLMLNVRSSILMSANHSSTLRNSIISAAANATAQSPTHTHVSTHNPHSFHEEHEECDSLSSSRANSIDLRSFATLNSLEHGSIDLGSIASWERGSIDLGSVVSMDRGSIDLGEWDDISLPPMHELSVPMGGPLNRDAANRAATNFDKQYSRATISGAINVSEKGHHELLDKQLSIVIPDDDDENTPAPVSVEKQQNDQDNDHENEDDREEGETEIIEVEVSDDENEDGVEIEYVFEEVEEGEEGADTAEYEIVEVEVDEDGNEIEYEEVEVEVTDDEGEGDAETGDKNVHAYSSVLLDAGSSLIDTKDYKITKDGRVVGNTKNRGGGGYHHLNAGDSLTEQNSLFETQDYIIQKGGQQKPKQSNATKSSLPNIPTKPTSNNNTNSNSSNVPPKQKSTKTIVTKGAGTRASDGSKVMQPSEKLPRVTRNSRDSNSNSDKHKMTVIQDNVTHSTHSTVPSNSNAKPHYATNQFHHKDNTLKTDSYSDCIFDTYSSVIAAVESIAEQLTEHEHEGQVELGVEADDVSVLSEESDILDRFARYEHSPRSSTIIPTPTAVLSHNASNNSITSNANMKSNSSRKSNVSNVSRNRNTTGSTLKPQPPSAKGGGGGRPTSKSTNMNNRKIV